MTEHLNFCRQLSIVARQRADDLSLSQADREKAESIVNLCSEAQKFLLPRNGTVIDDKQLRALDDSLPLSIPHKLIALEFFESLESNGRTVLAKRIVFCFEDENSIVVWPFANYQSLGGWANKPPLRLPKERYLDRSDSNEAHFFLQLWNADVSPEIASASDAGVLLGLCNALACCNVRIERSEPRNSGKKVKAALPFDSYHVLTIDAPGSAGIGLATGSHRSPREHLRRGHIRRLADGRRVWVNATVVAAGSGAGVVSKDYALRCAA